MKKVFALCLCAIMMLSVIPAMTFTASAAATGDWSTRRWPSYIDKEEDYIPTAGYYYDSEGFHTTSPVWTGGWTIYSVMSNEAYNLKDGFSMEFRVDDYLYDANGADSYIAVSFGTSSNITPGYVKNGGGCGVSALNRGSGNGTVVTYSYWTQEANEEGEGGSFALADPGASMSTATLDDQGREIYTVTASYEGGEYNICVNGVAIPAMAQISEQLEALSDTGDFYVTITFQTTAPDPKADMTILKVNDAIPTGTASKDAEVEKPSEPIGEMIDSSTVPAGQPSLIFDATKSCFSSDPGSVDAPFDPQGDNAYKVTPSVSSFFFTWGPDNSISYEASDFPVYAMLFKNISGEEGQVYYMSGENTGVNNSRRVEWWLYDDGCKEYTDAEGNVWNLVIVDLSDEEYDFTGRIDSFRIDIGGLEIDQSFDICYMATFRSIEDAQAYADDYTAKVGASVPAETEPATDPVTEPATDDATEPATGDEVATGDESATIDETKADATTTDTTATEDEGCSSVIGAGAAALVLSAMAAAVALKKKN